MFDASPRQAKFAAAWSTTSRTALALLLTAAVVTDPEKISARLRAAHPLLRFIEEIASVPLGRTLFQRPAPDGFCSKFDPLPLRAPWHSRQRSMRFLNHTP